MREQMQQYHQQREQVRTEDTLEIVAHMERVLGTTPPDTRGSSTQDSDASMCCSHNTKGTTSRVGGLSDDRS